MRLAFLAALSGESVFFLGPPGVAKSLIARRIKFAFHEAESFEYLMGRFSTPEEIFGPISLKKLKERDSYERLTRHYLPEADVVFLDEIWKASPPIQNALLTALNERLYRNGEYEIRLPLKLVVAASNEVPETHTEQAAFWDRFLLRVVLGPVTRESAFRELVCDFRDPYADPVPQEAKITDAEYYEWRNAAAAVTIPDEILRLLWTVAETMRDRSKGDLPLTSDRRWKKIAGLLRTSALLHGREAVNILDCGILENTLWDRPEQADPIRELLATAFRGFDPGWTRRIGDVRDQLDRSRGDLQERTNQERVVEVDVPVLYREEYYRLSNYPYEGLVLIWRGDWGRIATDGMQRCDLFFYTPEGRYSHTESVALRRCDGEPAVESEFGRYAVETEPQAKRIAEERAPTTIEMERHERTAEALMETITLLTREVVDFREQLHDQARSHLFLSEWARDAILAGVDVHVDEVGELDLQARRYRRAVPG